MVKRTHHRRESAAAEPAQAVERVSIASIPSFVLPTSPEVKNALLIELLKGLSEDGKAVVFCRSRNRADTLTKRLRKEGIKASGIHTGRSKNQRGRAIANYAEGNIPVLVAMHSLADEVVYGGTELAVSYDVPKKPETYVAIADFAALGAEIGRLVTFVTHDDYLDLRTIEAMLGAVLPTFEGADELELGDEPPVLDPARGIEAPEAASAAAPTRKTRKQAQEEAREARAVRRGSSESAAVSEDDMRPGRARRRRKQPTEAAEPQLQSTQGAPARTIAEADILDEEVAVAARGGAKKRGKKGSQEWEYVATEADMAGMGITWGVRQKKGEGRKQIPLAEILAELEEYAAEAKAVEDEHTTEPYTHSWDAMAAELAGLTTYSYDDAPSAGSAPTKKTSANKRRRRRRRTPKAGE